MGDGFNYRCIPYNNCAPVDTKLSCCLQSCKISHRDGAKICSGVCQAVNSCKKCLPANRPCSYVPPNCCQSSTFYCFPNPFYNPFAKDVNKSSFSTAKILPFDITRMCNKHIPINPEDKNQAKLCCLLPTNMDKCQAGDSITKYFPHSNDDIQHISEMSISTISTKQLEIRKKIPRVVSNHPLQNNDVNFIVNHIGSKSFSDNPKILSNAPLGAPQGKLYSYPGVIGAIPSVNNHPHQYNEMYGPSMTSSISKISQQFCCKPSMPIQSSINIGQAYKGDQEVICKEAMNGDFVCEVIPAVKNQQAGENFDYKVGNTYIDTVKYNSVKNGTTIPGVNIPESNIPILNIPNSNIPMSNIPKSNIPMSNIPMSNTPMSNTPMSNNPMSNITDSNIESNFTESNIPGSYIGSPIPGPNMPVSNIPGSNIPYLNSMSKTKIRGEGKCTTQFSDTEGNVFEVVGGVCNVASKPKFSSKGTDSERMAPYSVNRALSDTKTLDFKAGTIINSAKGTNQIITAGKTSYNIRTAIPIVKAISGGHSNKVGDKTSGIYPTDYTLVNPYGIIDSIDPNANTKPVAGNFHPNPEVFGKSVTDYGGINTADLNKTEVSVCDINKEFNATDLNATEIEQSCVIDGEIEACPDPSNVIPKADCNSPIKGKKPSCQAAQSVKSCQPSCKPLRVPATIPVFDESKCKYTCNKKSTGAKSSCRPRFVQIPTYDCNKGSNFGRRLNRLSVCIPKKIKVCETLKPSIRFKNNDYLVSMLTKTPQNYECRKFASSPSSIICKKCPITNKYDCPNPSLYTSSCSPISNCPTSYTCYPQPNCSQMACYPNKC